MPEDSFEVIKPNLYRFTIVERTAWDDPKHDYHLDMVVAFLEQGEGGKVRLWYSHHEHYARKRKNARWNLDSKMTYHLGRDLKDEISRRACHAWWHHCFGQARARNSFDSMTTPKPVKVRKCNSSGGVCGRQRCVW